MGNGVHSRNRHLSIGNAPLAVAAAQTGPPQPQALPHVHLCMLPARPELDRILETSLYVEDLDRSVRFYARIFGFEVMLQDDRMCAMAVPNRQVLLLFRKSASTMPSKSPVGFIPPHDADGRQHLCWSITHDALGTWQNYLATMGVDAGEEAFATISRFAEQEGLDGAALTALGAFERAKLGWFDPGADRRHRDRR
jgi:catechol 2,3-dioxygenase-like lactoylglutathione lyase family enzyme